MRLYPASEDFWQGETVRLSWRAMRGSQLWHQDPPGHLAKMSPKLSRNLVMGPREHIGH